MEGDWRARLGGGDGCSQLVELLAHRARMRRLRSFELWRLWSGFAASGARRDVAQAVTSRVDGVRRAGALAANVQMRAQTRLGDLFGFMNSALAACKTLASFLPRRGGPPSHPADVTVTVCESGGG